MIVKKCYKCNSLIHVLDDCNCDNCGFVCCGEEMKTLEPNTTDAAFEKHVPTYEIKGDKIVITVNHVMEEDHYIKWIAMETDNELKMIKLEPNDNPTVEYDYIKGATLYEYCNKHGLWSSKVE